MGQRDVGSPLWPHSSRAERWLRHPGTDLALAAAFQLVRPNSRCDQIGSAGEIVGPVLCMIIYNYSNNDKKSNKSNNNNNNNNNRLDYLMKENTI